MVYMVIFIVKRCFPKIIFIDPRSVVHAAAASMVEAVVSSQHHQHPYIHHPHHPHTSHPIKSEPNETSDHGTQKPEEKEQKGK